jgi:signal transduction histidine kinase
MLHYTLKRIITKVAGKATLRTVLIIPFVFLIVGTVGLVGYLSLRSGEKAVENLAGQLVGEVSDRVKQKLQHYLSVPKQINQNNAAAIRLGILNWQDFSTLESYFAQQLQIYPAASGIVLTTGQKEFLSVGRLLKSDSLVIRVLDASTNYDFHYYSADRQGKRGQLTQVISDYNPHNDPPNGRPWYQAAKQAKGSIWLPAVTLSQGVKNPTLIIANFLPFYDQDGSFQGVLSSGLFLPQLNNFLKGLKIGKTGQAYVIDREGFLISSSTGETPFKQNLDANYLQNLNPQDWKLAARNSKNALTKASMNSLLSYFGNLNQITRKQRSDIQVDNIRHFLQVSPVADESGLDYLVVVVVPEADFTEQIHGNIRTNVLLCIVALITAIIIGIFTARWIAKPIVRLNNAAKNLAKGQWETTVEVRRPDELGELAKSFNSMARQLQTSFLALQASENRLTQFLEALPVGIAIHNLQGQITYLNLFAKQLDDMPTLTDAKIDELAETYQIYQSGTQELYPVDQMPVVKALEGKCSKADDLELHYADRIIPIETWASPIYDETGQIVCVIAAFIDITERKKAQKVLADYNEVLEHEVIKRTSELIKLNQQLGHEIVERKQAEVALKESALREKAIAHVLQQMRRTLDINTIFSSTTQELRQVLKCDRVAIYQFNSDWNGKFITESVADGWVNLVSQQNNEYQQAKDGNCTIKNWSELELIEDTYLKQTQGGIYTKDESYLVVEDIYNNNFTDCYINLLEGFQARAYVIVPIFYRNKVWGLLAAYQNSGTRHWTEGDIKIVVQVGTQLGIAFQQAQLLEATQQQAIALNQALEELKRTQVQLIQAEKMSSLGQMVAGIAHEINNPVSFIYGNLNPARKYLQDILSLIELYQQTYPSSTSEIEQFVKDIDLDFLVEDWQKMINSMQVGAERIQEIVSSLRNFSRLDEKDLKSVDIHEGIENTLLILQHRLRAEGKRAEIKVIKNYGQLPKIACYANQLNQVFMNLISNAIDALKNTPSPRIITIHTSVVSRQKTSLVKISITDNGSGMCEEVLSKIFDPFFTTKPVGSGTGLGLSICYPIVVDRHQGKISCVSDLGIGTEFIVEIPLIDSRMLKV